MKGSLKASIWHNLSANHFNWLLLLSATSLLVGYSAKVSMAAPPQIAQATTAVTVNRPNLGVGSQGERVSELQAALKLLGFYTGAVDGIYNENTAIAVSQFKQSAGLSPDGIVDAITWQKLFPSEPIVTATQRQPNTAAGSPVTSVRNTTRVKPSSEPRPTTPRQTTISRNRATVVRTQPTARTQATVVRTQQTARIQPTPVSKQIPGVQYTSEGLPILRLGMRGADVVKLQQQLQRLGFIKGGIDGDFGATTDAAVKAAQTRYGLEADGVVGGSTWEALLRRSPQQR
ncbi:peptidoglycan-binding domain 1 protein [Cylindrospermum sp. NIES-4074]|nr:peptidoglycan-binding domain 1 protein [Cylindrospermum sp. NIES-4074]